MSSIPSLLTGGPAVSAQGNRGKTSSNSKGDGEAFARQLSENKTAQSTSSKKPENSPIQIKENSVAVDIELSNKSSQFADKMKVDYEFKSDGLPAILDVELPIDELEFSLEFDIVNKIDSLVEILPGDIATTSGNLPLDFEKIVLASGIESAPLEREIIAALNTQLSGKGQATENMQTTKSQLNNVNLETISPSANSSVSLLTTQMDVVVKSESADIVDLSKVIAKHSDAVSLNPPIQNVDAPRANNAPNVDVTKLSTNAPILANLANNDGLSDEGADHQRKGGSNPFVNQVNKAGVKVEGVDVLEARVFPAISPSNGTNIADALVKTRQLTGNAALQNLDPVYNTSQPKMINTLKIQLVPANLGVVTAVMKLTGGELQVQLQVENIEAYRKLNADSAFIVHTLKNQGFGIEQVNVQLMSGDRSSAQQGLQQNGQSFQGQAQQEASSSFDRDRRNPSTTNSNEQNQELGINESDVHQTSKVPDLSNGVYL